MSLDCVTMLVRRPFLLIGYRLGLVRDARGNHRHAPDTPVCRRRGAPFDVSRSRSGFDGCRDNAAAANAAAANMAAANAAAAQAAAANAAAAQAAAANAAAADAAAQQAAASLPIGAMVPSLAPWMRLDR